MKEMRLSQTPEKEIPFYFNPSDMQTKAVWHILLIHIRLLLAYLNFITISDFVTFEKKNDG
jgi:hypothetical protein